MPDGSTSSYTTGLLFKLMSVQQTISTRQNQTKYLGTFFCNLEHKILFSILASKGSLRPIQNTIFENRQPRWMCEDKSGYTARSKLCNKSQESKLGVVGWNLTQKGENSEDDRNVSQHVCAEQRDCYSQSCEPRATMWRIKVSIMSSDRLGPDGLRPTSHELILLLPPLPERRPAPWGLLIGSFTGIYPITVHINWLW